MIRLLIVWALAVASFRCGGQPLQLFLTAPTRVWADDTLYIDVRAAYFKDVGSLQFGLCWDAASLLYIDAATGALNNLGIGTAMAHQGQLGISWYAADGIDKTLPDSSVLLRVLFLPRPCSGNLPVSFCSLANLPIEAGSLTNGSVEIVGSEIYLPHPTHRIYKVLCPNQVFDFCEKRLTTSGIYTDTLQTASGCDSVLRLHLTVLPLAQSEADATICAGEVLNFHGKTLRNSGIYTDTLQTADGCDSLVLLRLTVRPMPKSEADATICAGEVLNFHGKTLRNSGIYTDTLQTTDGCDSLVLLRLTVRPMPQSEADATICAGEVLNFHGKTLRNSGIYTDTLQTADGCDSLVLLRLTVRPMPQSEADATICAGEVLDFHGKALRNSGIYTGTLQTTDGCDSLVLLRLTVRPMPQSEAEATICAGEVFEFHGKALRNSGIYTDTLQAADGCDSLVLLRLTVSKQGFYAPNVFSPDSTNDNAVFRIVGGSAMDHISVLRIYDRWGTLVFEEKNELQGWDGTRYGEACPPGVYVWYCEAICKNGAMLTQGGDVLLVR